MAMAMAMHAMPDSTTGATSETVTIDAAADVLGQVLASDRADIPAIAQRRELANQIPPTMRAQQLQLRCEVPDWWHTLRAQTSSAIEDAQQAIGTVSAERQDRADRRANAAAKFAIRQLRSTRTETSSVKRARSSSEPTPPTPPPRSL